MKTVNDNTGRARGSGAGYAAFVAVSMILSAMPTYAEFITVGQGETLAVSTAKTVTAMDVHGTLNVQGTEGSPAEMEFSPLATTATLGTASGDNAIIRIGDFGRISGGQFTIGGASAAGGFEIGGKRKNNATGYELDGATAHLATGQITVPADATSASGVIDILTLNAGGYAGIRAKNAIGPHQAIVNRSTKADARVLFNGGVLAFFNSSGSYLFFSDHSSTSGYTDIIPSGEGGKTIILEGINGNPVEIHTAGGSSAAGVLVWLSVGKLRFRGASDVILHGAKDSNISGWKINSPSHWEHRGDLKLTGSMRLQMTVNNALPKSASNGIVQLLGNQLSYLDLNAKSNAVNGIVVSGQAVLTNSSATAAQLVLGSAAPDGVFSVARFGGGPIEAVKTGSGTLTVTNTPSFPYMRVDEGQVLFKDDDCTLGSLVARAGSSLVVDRCTLSLESSDSASANFQVNRGATFDCAAIVGGQTVSCLTVDCADGVGDGVLSNVRFAPTGVIRLVNVAADLNASVYPLPLVFTGSADEGNLGGWTVYVNGENKGRKLASRNNRLVFQKGGLTIVVR